MAIIKKEQSFEILIQPTRVKVRKLHPGQKLKPGRIQSPPTNQPQPRTKLG